MVGLFVGGGVVGEDPKGLMKYYSKLPTENSPVLPLIWNVD